MALTAGLKGQLDGFRLTGLFLLRHHVLEPRGQVIPTRWWIYQGGIERGATVP